MSRLLVNEMKTQFFLFATASALLAAGLIIFGVSHVETLYTLTTTSAEPLESELTLKQSPSAPVIESGLQERRYTQLRGEMVDQQIARRGITDRRVLEAIRRVPRHQFVPESRRHLAYTDSPLPMGHRQTISQPLIVAEMTQLARTTPQSKALDVGTGSGYQAAVLAELVDHVYSIEILQPLADKSRDRLKTLGYDNVEVRCDDGYHGWPEQAPFDLIIVAAAPNHVPKPLVEQLAPGGRLVIPVGDRFIQNLLIIEKRPDGTIHRQNIVPVAFVPMTGEAEKNSAR